MSDSIMTNESVSEVVRWLLGVVEARLGLLDSVMDLSCDRDHHNDDDHVGCLGLGVQEGGEGDILSSLL